MFVQISASVLVAASLAALSSTALAADKSLVQCNVDGESFNVSLVSTGVLRVKGVEAQLVSARKVPAAGTKFVYEIMTAQGNELLVRKANDGSVQLWDRNVIGGGCASASVKVDTLALDAFVARTNQLKSATWRLADCDVKNDPSSSVVISYRVGFIPGTIVATSSVGPSGEVVAYVLSSVEKQGAMGTSYTSLKGKGAYSYSAAGRHTRPLNQLTVAHSNVSNTDRIITGESNLDDNLGQCAISNLWHVEKLLTK